MLWGAPEPTQPRHAIYGTRIDGFRIENFRGRQAAAGDQLATIGLDRCRDVFITGSRATPGTRIFVGVSGVALDEVALAGNDLREASQDLRRGATHPGTQ